MAGRSCSRTRRIFTPVCTTELGMMAGMAGEFARRNAKIIGISVDPVEDHHKWKGDIKAYTGNEVTYPMIGDPDMKVAKLYDHAARVRRTGSKAARPPITRPSAPSSSWDPTRRSSCRCPTR